MSVILVIHCLITAAMIPATFTERAEVLLPSYEGYFSFRKCILVALGLCAASCVLAVALIVIFFGIYELVFVSNIRHVSTAELEAERCYPVPLSINPGS